MTAEQVVRILAAQLCLAVWNPDLWNFHPDTRLRNRMQLTYRTRGIVLHDRELNGEIKWLN